MYAELVKIGTSLMLLAGAAVMAANVVRFHRLLRRHQHLKDCATGTLNRIFSVHKVLMVFFVFGYLAVFGATISAVSFVSETLVGVIFLSGAVFVLLGIEVQNRMLKESRQNYFRAIRMLVRAVEIRDPYTMGHSEHVANLCMLVHGQLPQTEQKGIDAELLHSTALMHDIGKIGVPERVLNKPGRLTDDEWALIRRHTTIGKDLLSKMSVCSSVPEWVVYHHERIDGRGYHGLAGQGIPLAARLMAVADTYSAIVTDRPYRRGKTHSDAVSILQANAGTQLDEDIVGIFCMIPQEVVAACRPQALALDFMQEIEKMEQQMLRGDGALGAHSILSVEAGERWLHQMALFCRKRGEHLTLAALHLEGLNDLEQTSGYHTVDDCVDRVGALLIDNTRNTDVVVQCRRGVFILGLPECAVDLGVNLLDRIHGEIIAGLEGAGITLDSGVSRRLVAYDPDDDESWGALTGFLVDHFSEAADIAPQRLSA
ncbi:MAG: HD domain-containing phosphohydrolase [Pseudomonadota bacterium]